MTRHGLNPRPSGRGVRQRKDGEIRVDHRSAGISKDCSSKRVRVVQETETDLEGALAMLAALAGEDGES